MSQLSSIAKTERARLNKGRGVVSSTPPESQANASKPTSRESSTTPTYSCFPATYKGTTVGTLGAWELHELLTKQQAILDALSAAIRTAQAANRKRSTTPPRQRRLEIIERLLANEHIDQLEVRDVDYELETSWHLALIAGKACGQPEHALNLVAEELGCAVLSVASSEATLWTWFGTSEPLRSADLEAALAVRAATGLKVAVGEPGKGVTGWRTSHRQAREAHAVGNERDRTLTRFADVALVALLRQDAQTLIEIYLSPLDSHPEPEMLRETLRAYLKAGHNASSAASAVGSDRRTVHRRLRWVERALGRNLSEVSAEVDLALRLEALVRTSAGSAR